MITRWLYRRLPGPRWARATVLLALAALFAWLLWTYGFALLVQHYRGYFDSDPIVG